MRWRHLHFPGERRVSPSDLISHFTADEAAPVTVFFANPELGKWEDGEAVELLRSVSAYRGLTAFLLSGQARGWLLGLAATVDLTIATESSIFSLEGMEEKTAGFTSALLSHLIGKAKTVQILIDGEVSARRLQRLGLVARLVSAEELADPKRLVEDMFSGVVLGAVTRLKRTWIEQEGRKISEALAAERLEFQRCFREGAAGEIAEYLMNRKRT